MPLFDGERFAEQRLECSAKKVRFVRPARLVENRWLTLQLELPRQGLDLERRRHDFDELIGRQQR